VLLARSQVLNQHLVEVNKTKMIVLIMLKTANLFVYRIRKHSKWKKCVDGVTSQDRQAERLVWFEGNSKAKKWLARSIGSICLRWLCRTFRLKAFPEALMLVLKYNKTLEWDNVSQDVINLMSRLVALILPSMMMLQRMATNERLRAPNKRVVHPAAMTEACGW